MSLQRVAVESPRRPALERSGSAARALLITAFVTCNVAAWRVHESGYASIGGGCALKGFGRFRFGYPTCGRQNSLSKLTANRLPSLLVSTKPVTKHSSTPFPSTGPASEAR